MYKEKALVGSFSVIVKTLGTFVSSSNADLVPVDQAAVLAEPLVPRRARHAAAVYGRLVLVLTNNQ